MSTKYLPIKTSSIASEWMVDRFFHPTVHMPEEDRKILDMDQNSDPIEDNMTDQSNILGENTNYAPDRSYISTPSGNDKTDDETKTVQELDKEEENKPILDEPEEGDSSTLKEGATPRSIVGKQIKYALGQKNTNGIRSRIDVIRDHVRYNAQFINTLFYSSPNAYYATKETVKELPFLRYFYPNVITHNFYSRLHTSLGGISISSYQNLLYNTIFHLRTPFSSNKADLLGEVPDKIDMERLQEVILSGYNSLNNWFRVDLSSDIDHFIYCAKLYAITGYILSGATFQLKYLSPAHIDILHEWRSRVSEHVEKIRLAKKESEAWFKEAQYLHDLMWSCLDDINSPECCQECLFAFCAAMNHVSADAYTQDRSLMSIKDSELYMLVQLGYEDDIYLIPDKALYPVINSGSVKLAVDSIEEVKKEYPDDVDTYVSNLNRKYKEFNCSFSISPDHPFAPYADKEMIDNMTFILAEANTAVNDVDGAADLNSPINQTDQPWYKRIDYIGALYRDGSENKELGPNTKPQQKPDYTMYTSVF